MSKYIINQRFIDCINFILDTKKAPSKSFLAEKFSISNSKFSEILKERMNVGVELLSVLTNEFSISPEWLLTGKGEMLKQPQGYTTEENPPQVVAEGQSNSTKVIDNSHLNGQISFLQKEIEYLQDKISLLQENKTLIEEKVKKTEAENQQLQEQISHLKRENSAIKSKPQDRATG
ncbi:hypothetical protein [Riemerella columbina]|uniref:hypothetical protein n=1 Tax=Riemerella columbina TaxID=103810 RepID=UPI00036BD30E|nr:hypothetical protein [Riemerella columbina]